MREGRCMLNKAKKCCRFYSLSDKNCINLNCLNNNLSYSNSHLLKKPERWSLCKLNTNYFDCMCNNLNYKPDRCDLNRSKSRYCINILMKMMGKHLYHCMLSICLIDCRCNSQYCKVHICERSCSNIRCYKHSRKYWWEMRLDLCKIHKGLDQNMNNNLNYKFDMCCWYQDNNLLYNYSQMY